MNNEETKVLNQSEETLVLNNTTEKTESVENTQTAAPEATAEKKKFAVNDKAAYAAGGFAAGLASGVAGSAFAATPSEVEVTEEVVTPENAEATEEGGECWNYCELELSIGADAKIKGLGAYLPEVIFIDKVNNYYVYEQAKAEVLEEATTYRSLSRNSRKRTEDFCDSNGAWCFNALWIEDFIRAYGEKEFLILNDFLNEYCVDDLHDGNLGYVNGKPVIIDYASYRDF